MKTAIIGLPQVGKTSLFTILTGMSRETHLGGTAVEDVNVDDSVVDYLMAIVERTRNHEQLGLGVSPRGSIALYRASQALALVEGLDYSTPDHVKRLAVPVFAHRSIADARSGGGNGADRKVEILEEILQSVPVPL